MTKYKVIALIVGAASLGMLSGIFIANWQFRDPEVLLAARVLLGGFGAAIFGFTAKAFILAPDPGR